MNLRTAIRHEERKLERQLVQIKHQLNTLRAAAKSLVGRSGNGRNLGMKKRFLTEEGRARISRAAKRRWARVRSQAKKTNA